MNTGNVYAVFLTLNPPRIYAAVMCCYPGSYMNLYALIQNFNLRESFCFRLNREGTQAVRLRKGSTTKQLKRKTAASSSGKQTHVFW